MIHHPLEFKSELSLLGIRKLIIAIVLCVGRHKVLSVPVDGARHILPDQKTDLVAMVIQR